jgi:beta-lactamase superfamily II metal-dependent hydrolase
MAIVARRNRSDRAAAQRRPRDFVDADGRANDWLINCGNENAVDFTLKDFLRAQGVNKIPRLALTEGDAKNIGGAQALDQLFGVGELWTSDCEIPFRRSIATPLHRLKKRPAPQNFELREHDWLLAGFISQRDE